VWSAVAAHREYLTAGGGLEARRGLRMRREVEALAAERFRVRVAASFDDALSLAEDLAARRVDPYRAAAILGATAAARD
jgi:hypothetical protein